MGINVKKSSLVIDGGNVVKIGDKAIMTEKVFYENSGVSSKWLKRKIQNHLECEVVFIPWDKYEFMVIRMELSSHCLIQQC